MRSANEGQRSSLRILRGSNVSRSAAQYKARVGAGLAKEVACSVEPRNSTLSLSVW